MIYLDSAATSYHKPEGVAKAVADAIQHLGNSGRGAHTASLDASRIIYETRYMISELFHAEGPAQVAFTANSTESINLAVMGLLLPGDHVITTAMEHNSVLRPLYLMEERGVELTIIPADKKGMLHYSDFEEAVRKNTKAIVCTHASNLTGNPVDIGRVGSICRRYNILFLLDASQSAGVLPVDMEQMHIDILCFTGHKGLMGPQGTGGICVKKGLKLRPLVVGGSGVSGSLKAHPEDMPEALEAGTLNGHGIAGLHAALAYLKETGIAQIARKERMLLNRFLNGISCIPGVTLYGEFGMESRPPIAALNIRDYDSGAVADELCERYGILTRAGIHCAPLMHDALGTKGQGAVRFSMSYFNTADEIDAAAKAVSEIAGQ